jgi:enoyl-CoA hydratase/carnithine racemase
MKRLLSFPSEEASGNLHTLEMLTIRIVPTIAAINGHCFAAGMILALCCDYRVMTDGSERNAWMCMNEV